MGTFIITNNTIENCNDDYSIFILLKQHMKNSELHIKGLSSKNRAHIHRVAGAYNLEHYSTGDYSNRTIVIKDPSHSYFYNNPTNLFKPIPSFYKSPFLSHMSSNSTQSIASEKKDTITKEDIKEDIKEDNEEDIEEDIEEEADTDTYSDDSEYENENQSIDDSESESEDNKKIKSYKNFIYKISDNYDKKYTQMLTCTYIVTTMNFIMTTLIMYKIS